MYCKYILSPQPTPHVCLIAFAQPPVELPEAPRHGQPKQPGGVYRGKATRVPAPWVYSSLKHAWEKILQTL